MSELTDRDKALAKIKESQLTGKKLSFNKKELLSLEENEVPKTHIGVYWGYKKNKNVGNPQSISEGRLKISERKRAQAEVLNGVRDGLFEIDQKTGLPMFKLFIKNLIETSVSKPNHYAAQHLARVLIPEGTIEKLDESLDRQMAKDHDFLRFRLVKNFFDKQRDVLFDLSNTKIKKRIICTSRRGGKTKLNAGMFVWMAIEPNTPMIYINLTFTNAIKQLFDDVILLSAEIDLPIARSSKAEGFIEWYNGSTLIFRGNSNSSEADKIRGYKARLVVIDEGGHHRWVRYLIDEVLNPLMLDYADSQLIMTGTPPRIPHTYFEEAANSKEFKKSHWTMMDNPFIPNPEEAIIKIAEDKGLSLDAPFIQREYYGKIGVYDTEAMVYLGRKTFKEIPDNFVVTDIVGGIDYGFVNNNAIILVAFNRITCQGYVFYEDQFNHANITTIVERANKAFEEAKKIAIKHKIDLGSITFYCDTSDQSISYEMSTTYKIPTQNAYKHDRMMAINQMAEELRTGRIKIIEDGLCDNDFGRIVYKRDENTDAILNETDEELYHSDLQPALLYALRWYFYICNINVGGDNV